MIGSCNVTLFIGLKLLGGLCSFLINSVHLRLRMLFIMLCWGWCITLYENFAGHIVMFVRICAWVVFGLVSVRVLFVVVTFHFLIIHAGLYVRIIKNHAFLV